MMFVMFFQELQGFEFVKYLYSTIRYKAYPAGTYLFTYKILLIFFWSYTIFKWPTDIVEIILDNI